MTLLRIAAIVLLVLATICAIVPTTIAGGDWSTFTAPGLLCWLLDVTVPSPPVFRGYAR